MQITFKHSLCFLARSFLLLLLLYLFFLLFCVLFVLLLFFFSSHVFVTVAAKQRRLWPLRRADTRKNETRRVEATRRVALAARLFRVSLCASNCFLFFFLFIFFVETSTKTDSNSHTSFAVLRRQLRRGGRMRIAVRFGDRLDRLLWGLAAVKASLCAPLSSLLRTLFSSICQLII